MKRNKCRHKKCRHFTDELTRFCAECGRAYVNKPKVRLSFSFIPAINDKFITVKDLKQLRKKQIDTTIRMGLLIPLVSLSMYLFIMSIYLIFGW